MKKFPVNSKLISKLTKDLTFSCEKAKRELNWNPKVYQITFNMMYYISYFFINIYFKWIFFCKKFKIFDNPNSRSSHSEITVRGAGVIIPLISLFSGNVFLEKHKLYLFGLFLVGIISFIDDIKSLPNKIRIVFHFFAVLLFVFNFQYFDLPGVYIILLLFLFLGVINAVNFMDGINGISGFYGIVFLNSIIIQNNYFHSDFEFKYSLNIIIALSAFLTFNFRKNAICFLGDVGSISLAYVFLFFISDSLRFSNSSEIFIFLFLYGLDTGYTILFRVLKKENIFTPHRLHLYQLFVNEKRYSPLFVSTLNVYGENRRIDTLYD
ncbi:MAG: UDP-GlcNAc--UDP-phosphate GlcNAc-1-phosphate transferase [Cytophagaceae bacterium]|nr:UDP-GlcNAc--UDP-phosphate GlcNAc-1-phosphate transferase [Cytophagaceae bacterium]